MSNTSAVTNQTQITEAAFLSADTDGNGYLDQAEFDRAFSGNDFSSYDVDKNSMISLNEATSRTEQSSPIVELIGVVVDFITNLFTGSSDNTETKAATKSAETSEPADDTGTEGTEATVSGFDEADIDGNGSLDRSEFEDALPGEDFDAYDDDRDGKVTEEEVANNIQLTQEDMEKILNNQFMSKMLEKIKKKREEADAELVNNNKFATTPTSFI